MPARALRPCAKCGALTKGRFCGAHAGEARRQNQLYDAARANDPVRRLYGTQRWRWTSREVIARDPVCKECRCEPSTLADHVIPAQQYVAQSGGDLEAFFDLENLQGLGVACHAKKTAKDGSRGGSGGQCPGTARPATAVQLSTRVSRSEKLPPSVHVDHVIRAEVYVEMQGGDEEFFYDEKNLRGACEACHSHKTALENAGTWDEALVPPLPPEVEALRAIAARQPEFAL